jgi:UDP-N-acetylglucosamine 4,6-dehydratase
MFKRKNILITGGAGSLGHALTTQILKENPGKIVIYSTDDMKHANMEAKFKDDRIRYIVGDIRDYNRLYSACQGIDIIIHCSALKNVDRGEYNALEYKEVIVDGAETIIKVCMNTPSIKNVVALSTDKASNPMNLYGAAKLLSDRLFVAANKMCDTKFSVIRYGNVIASNGSILDRIKDEKVINLTDERMTRFWITLDYASKLVLYLCKNMEGGEIFIPNLPGCHVKEFLNIIYNYPDFNIIGIRPGEKLHESMFLKSDCLNMLQYEYFYIIYPSIQTKPKMFGDYIGHVIDEKDYTSENTKWKLTKDDIINIYNNVNIYPCL